MARMKRSFGNTHARPSAVKIKPVKVDVNGLRAAYEWALIDRLQGIQQATEWYQANVAVLLFGHPLDEAARKQFDKATKSALLGNSSIVDNEKLQAWTTALRLYERIWADRHALPDVTAAMTAADEGVRPGKRVAAMGEIIGALNGAFQSQNLKFMVTSSADRTFAEGTIGVPLKELEALSGKSLMQLVLGEAVEVAKVKSVVTVDGTKSLDGGLFFVNLPLVLEGIHAWASTQDLRAIFKVGRTVAPQTKSVKATGSRKVSARPMGLTSVDPFGIFRPNTVKAAIASLMYDRNPHSLDDLKALCAQYAVSTGPIYHTLREIKTKVNVTRNGNVFQVV